MKNGIDSIEIEEIENYLSYIRPNEEMRAQIDIGYRIEKQSVIIFEVRPDWRDPKKKVENNIAKATFKMAFLQTKTNRRRLVGFYSTN
jgi:hypothetical protein